MPSVCNEVQVVKGEFRGMELCFLTFATPHDWIVFPSMMRRVPSQPSKPDSKQQRQGKHSKP